MIAPINIRFDKVAIALALGLLFTLTAPAANAGTLYSTGFENPPFTLGPLAGQDGWQVFGGTSVQVENTVVFAGSQAVSVDGHANGQSGPFHQDPTVGPVVELSAWINLASSSGESAWQFAGLGSGLAPFIGGLDVDAGTGLIHLITAGFPTAGTLTRDAWHKVDFVFNFTTQQYNFLLDGVQLGTNVAFCGDNGPCGGAHIGAYGDGLFDTFGGGNDTGYLDNFSVGTVTSTPEPSSLMLVGSGAVGLAGVLRRKLAR